MKCYFALTAPKKDSDAYVDLLEVSLKSARQNTTMHLVALYDGSKESRCYKLLQQYEVEIIEHQFSHKKYTDELYKVDFGGRPTDSDKVAGTFMRLDIPFVEQEEEFVLYSDIDVIFLKDITLEDLPKPQYLAGCSEFNMVQNMEEYFNAGVLVLNVRNMREMCNCIFDDLKHGRTVVAFDQGYLNKYCLASRTWLPFEFNWKPYWGINPDASIVHFHGMKPGSTIAESGFGMSETVIINITHSKESFAGQLYYYIKYFTLLDSATIDWQRWVAEFMAYVNELLLLNVKNNLPHEGNPFCVAHAQKKLKKKKKQYKVINVLTLGVTYKRNKKKLKAYREHLGLQ